MGSPTLDQATPPENTPPDEPEILPKGIYKCGTLRYTTFGLVMVFIWLLWGDFIWSLMDGAVPNILPLKLTGIGASDTTNQVLTGGLAYAIVFLFAPAASIASDRHRGPLGRRIPFLLWSTPFVGLFLILIGCYEDLTRLFIGHADHITFFQHWTFGRPTVTLTIFGIVYVGYDFANIFVSTIYWYLFNDVVPSQYLSRFMSLFRVVGGAAGMAYNRWIYPHALDRFKEIFIIAGIAYVVGFMLMCFFVREGDYPPPPPMIGKPGYIERFTNMIRMFARDCFTHRFYWFFFLANTFSLFSYRAGRLGQNRDNLSLGLSLTQLGTVGQWSIAISMALQYPAGWMADRYSPIRVFIVTRFIAMLGLGVQLIWIFRDFGNHGNLLLMYVTNFVFLPFGVLNDAAEMPMYMRLLPRDRYGQFCSANAMLRAFAAIFGSYYSGRFLDMMAAHEHALYWHYRYIPVWTLFFQIPSLIFLVLLYRQWKKLGGDLHYTPP